MRNQETKAPAHTHGPLKKKKEAKPKTVEDDKKTWQVKNWVQYLLKLGKAKKKKRTITKSKLNMD